MKSNLSVNSIKEIKPKTVVSKLLDVYTSHSITSLFILAGLLIGFSLLQVRKYADGPTSTGATSSEAPVSLQKIRLDEATVERLEGLKDDVDVIIDSDLPDGRTNPFL